MSEVSQLITMHNLIWSLTSLKFVYLEENKRIIITKKKKKKLRSEICGILENSERFPKASSRSVRRKLSIV